MVTLLVSGKQDVVYTVCGVLINLMADEDKRPNLKRLGGIKLYGVYVKYLLTEH